MKNRFTLAIVILFGTHTLFSAQDFKELYIEDKSSQQSPDREQLTAELKEIFEGSDFEVQSKHPIIKKLIRSGASTNISTTQEETFFPLLSYACSVDDIDFAKDCVDHGACLENTDKFGMTALGCCESVSMVRLLLEAKANPNHQNNRRQTALHLLARNDDSIELIEELCCYIVPSHKKRADTPLHFLCQKERSTQVFGRTLSTLLWWSEPQLRIENSERLLPRFYVERFNYGNISMFDAISEEITRARAQLFQQKNQEIETVVGEFMSIGGIARLICIYFGSPLLEPPYTSLRDFMISEESKREYPAIAQAFLSKELI